jgi:hypothetical protein
MRSQPVFCDEADYERWLASALEAERQRLKLQVMPRESRPPTQPNDVHTLRQGDAA